MSNTLALPVNVWVLSGYKVDANPIFIDFEAYFCAAQFGMILGWRNRHARILILRRRSKKTSCGQCGWTSMGWYDRPHRQAATCLSLRCAGHTNLWMVGAVTTWMRTMATACVLIRSPDLRPMCYRPQQDACPSRSARAFRKPEYRSFHCRAHARNNFSRK